MIMVSAAGVPEMTNQHIYAQSLLRRFIQLRGISCKDQPLAIYQNKSGIARNITADIVNILLCELAVEAYDLKNIDEIQKFSTYSAVPRIARLIESRADR